jgi:DNA-binding LytR/AlgR family response regulator
VTCLIIEDQPPAQRILRKYIEDLGTLQLLEVFGDPLKAMAYLEEHPVDLVFLDINLPKLSGIALLKTLKKKPQVILTTAYSEYALEGYELDVVDYLLKPFSFERFLKSVSKVRRPQMESHSPAAPARKEHFVKIGYEHIRIAFEDILYLAADGDYCEIFLEGKKHLSSESLKKWIELLEGWDFFRIHKSYLVNIHQIDKVSGNTIFLHDGTQLPLGRAYKDDFMEKYLR